jgi:hypothetical protein
MRRVATVVVGLSLLGAVSARAQVEIVLEEVLASWKGDATVQFVELRMLAEGQQFLEGKALLAFDDATGREETRTILLFDKSVNIGDVGSRVLIATPGLAVAAGMQPDFVIQPGAIDPQGGRVCYQAVEGAITRTDCVSWGDYAGDRLGFGPPVVEIPSNRSLRRIRLTGRNLDDWTTELQPTPTNNSGVERVLVTTCGNGAREFYEECDPPNFAGETCASLGFVGGDLRCRECYFDLSQCTACGNGSLNGDEECDGNDFGSLSCSRLGFAGGELACSETCERSTEGCDPTFDVPGGGSGSSDCLVEWRLTNAAGRPDDDGKVKRKQRCVDGDPGCDLDDVVGTCTVAVGLCFGREDARLPECGVRPLEEWKLKRPKTDDERSGPLLDAVAALGGTRVENEVTFSPPLDVADTCTELVTVTLAVKETLKLKSRGVGQGNRPKDGDTVKVICRPADS